MGFPGFILGSASFAEATAFDEFFDQTTKTTTSNGWVTHSQFITDDAKETGFYYLGWSLQYGQSDKQKRVGIRVQERLQGSVSWITISDIRWTVGFADTFGRDSAFKIIQVPIEANVELRIQWGQTDDGGVGKLQDVNLILYKVGELP